MGFLSYGAGLDGGSFNSFNDRDLELQLLVFGFDKFSSPSVERPKKRGGTQFLCIQDPSTVFPSGGNVNPVMALLMDLCPLTWVEYPGITQFDVSAACGGGFRAGFNLMELVDFLCGWTTLDMLRDDIRIKKLKEESIQAAKLAARKAASEEHKDPRAEGFEDTGDGFYEKIERNKE